MKKRSPCPTCDIVPPGDTLTPIKRLHFTVEAQARAIDGVHKANESLKKENESLRLELSKRDALGKSLEEATSRQLTLEARCNKIITSQQDEIALLGAELDRQDRVLSGLRTAFIAATEDPASPRRVQQSLACGTDS